MRSQYDFIKTKVIRGKHSAAYARGTNRVSLDPDVAAVFPDERSVNEALRGLVQLAKRQASTNRSRKAG
jgi:hypothetical protein